MNGVSCAETKIVETQKYFNKSDESLYKSFKFNCKNI